jgi:hypothetical protein
MEERVTKNLHAAVRVADEGRVAAANHLAAELYTLNLTAGGADTAVK